MCTKRQNSTELNSTSSSVQFSSVLSLRTGLYSQSYILVRIVTPSHACIVLTAELLSTQAYLSTKLSDIAYIIYT